MIHEAYTEISKGLKISEDVVKSDDNEGEFFEIENAKLSIMCHEGTLISYNEFLEEEKKSSDLIK